MSESSANSQPVEEGADEPALQREAILIRLLDEFAAQAHSGKTPDFDAVRREHPELVEELRQLWATALVAEDLATLSHLLDGPADEPAAAGAESSPHSPLAKQKRIGDYEILEEIGRGGMGVVYRARQISLGRTVALKMVLRGAWRRPRTGRGFERRPSRPRGCTTRTLRRFTKSAKRRVSLTSACSLWKGRRWPAGSPRGPCPREAARTLLPICRAIAEAHKSGLLHRDLKPSNILIDRTGRPYVSDFGLAKRVTADATRRGAPETAAALLTHSGAIVGTPGYMAPEQAAGNRGEVSRATDVYGLGALLYAMLTGHAPFQSASPVDTVLQVLEQDPLPPRVVNPQADADLEMIALKCLQKPPELRYQTADELADDLEAYLANEPISARSGRLTQVLSRTFRETHHAVVLENWGVLWMWHSLVLVVLCLVTNFFQWRGIASRLPYVALWSMGLGVWAVIFWNLRRRSGPITFVERQIAHVWAGSVICSTLLFGIEALLQLPVLTLSPVLGLVSGMVFLVKAGILSGAVLRAGGRAVRHRRRDGGLAGDRLAEHQHFDFRRRLWGLFLSCRGSNITGSGMGRGCESNWWIGCHWRGL